MNNNLFSQYQNNQPSYLQANEDELDDHFNTLLGNSQSRYTAAESLNTSSPTNEQSFHSSRIFAISTLESWGMKIGTLPYSKDNQTTLKCILDLITQKQKDSDYKIKAKQQLNAINFEKQKYQSLLKQAKNTINEKQKLLGKIENQSLQLKKKLKIFEDKTKKEKADDQKMILMLKSKNDLLLHQVKKKQVEILRIKDQMKKSVTTKTGNKNQSFSNQNNYSVKNTFEIIQKIQRLGAKGQKWKKNSQTQRSTKTYSQSADEQKFSFMIDKYEKQKKIFFNENSLLRDKIYEIREILLSFAQWIEIQLFGQTTQSTAKYLQKKFICNHNMILGKDALIEDLIQVVNSAKNGIVQLQQRVIQSEGGVVKSSKSIETPGKKKFTNPPSKALGLQTNGQFKKKSTSIRESVTFNINTSPINSKSQKSAKIIAKQSKNEQRSKVLSKNSRKTEPLTSKNEQIFQATYKIDEMGQQNLHSQMRMYSKQNYFNELQLSAFENDVLSDIYQNSKCEDQDHSIVSHISTSQLLKQIERGKAGKYDKWDVLFKSSQFNDDEEQNQ